MKRFSKCILWMGSVLMCGLAGCGKEGALVYAGPDLVNFDYRKMELQKDTVVVAYGFVQDQFREVDLKLFLTGYAAQVDREVNLKVSSEEGAEAGVHYQLPEKVVIPANEVEASVPLRILRPAALLDKSVSFWVRLEDSESFRAGIRAGLFFQVSDEIPEQWIGDENWYEGSIEDYFGECSRTKYLFVYQQLGVWDFDAYSVWGMMADANKFAPAKRIVKEKLAEYEAANGPLVDPEKGRVTFPD